MISKCEFLLTVSNKVDANYYYGLTNACIYASVTPSSKQPRSPACYCLIRSMPFLQRSMSSSFHIT